MRQEHTAARGLQRAAIEEGDALYHLRACEVAISGLDRPHSRHYIHAAKLRAARRKLEEQRRARLKKRVRRAQAKRNKALTKLRAERRIRQEGFGAINHNEDFNLKYKRENYEPQGGRRAPTPRRKANDPRGAAGSNPSKAPAEQDGSASRSRGRHSSSLADVIDIICNCPRCREVKWILGTYHFA